LPFCASSAVVTLALTPLTLLLFGQVSLVGLLANLLAIPWVTLVVTPLACWACCGRRCGSLAAPGGGAAGGAAAMAGGLALGQRVDGGGAAVGGRGGGGWAACCWPCAALAAARCWACRWCCPAAVAARAAGARAVRTAGGRHRPGQCRAGAHRHPHTCCTTPARATRPKATPATACWCRCCAPGRAAGHAGAEPPRQRPHRRRGAVLASSRQAHAAVHRRRRTRTRAGRAPGSAARPASAGAGTAWISRCCTRAPDDYATARQSPTPLSCVLRVRSAGGHGACWPATSSGAGAARCWPAGARLRADLLLVPHHGSKTSSSAPFLDAVQPRLALVQAGYRNRFGHPAARGDGALPGARHPRGGVARCGAAPGFATQPGRCSASVTGAPILAAPLHQGPRWPGHHPRA
jgi:competence protein ComEC